MDRFLRNNNVLRILAIVLACILWLAVHAPADPSQAASGQTQTGVSEHYTLPIQVQVGDDTVISSMSQSTATVNVTTSLVKSRLTLPEEMLKVQLVANSQGLGPGTHVLHIAALNMPKDIQGATISPQTFTVVLEKKTHQEKTVDVIVKGAPAQGYTVGQLHLNTQAVDVSGSHTLVQSVAQVVGTLDVSGMKSTTTKIVNLTPVDEHGKTVQNVDLAPSSISVDVPLQTTEEKVKLQPQVTGTPAAGYAVSGVTLDNQSVSEAGLAGTDLPPDGLKVPVNVTGLSKSMTLTVAVPLLQGMTQVTPSTVAAKVTIEPSATATFQKVPISVQNEPRGRQVTLVNHPTVDVTVTGPQSIVSKLSAADVQVYVDASALTPSDTKGDITVSAPTWVDVVNLSVRSVAVKVQ